MHTSLIKTILFICCLTLVVSACSSLTTIMPQMQFSRNEGTIDCSNVLYDCQIVNFRTSGTESILGNIARLLVSRDRYYVLDSKEKKVVSFDKNGCFERSTEQLMGRGAGEYSSIMDATWDNSDKKVYLLCDVPHQIMILNEDLSLNKCVALEFLANEICVMDDYIYITRTNKDKIEVLSCRKDDIGKFRSLYSVEDIPGLCGKGKSMNRSGNLCYVCLPFDNRVLFLNDGGIEKMIELNIDGWYENRNSAKNGPREFMETHNGESWIVQNICASDSIILFNTNLPNIYVGNMNLMKGVVRQILPISFPIVESEILPAQEGKKYLYAYCIPAESIVRYKEICKERGIKIKNESAKELIESYDANKNPLVVIAEIK